MKNKHIFLIFCLNLSLYASETLDNCEKDFLLDHSYMVLPEDDRGSEVLSDNPDDDGEKTPTPGDGKTFLLEPGSSVKPVSSMSNAPRPYTEKCKIVVEEFQQGRCCKEPTLIKEYALPKKIDTLIAANDEGMDVYTRTLGSKSKYKHVASCLFSSTGIKDIVCYKDRVFVSQNDGKILILKIEYNDKKDNIKSCKKESTTADNGFVKLVMDTEKKSLVALLKSTQENEKDSLVNVEFSEKGLSLKTLKAESKLLHSLDLDSFEDILVKGGKAVISGTKEKVVFVAVISDFNEREPKLMYTFPSLGLKGFLPYIFKPNVDNTIYVRYEKLLQEKYGQYDPVCNFLEKALIVEHDFIPGQGEPLANRMFTVYDLRLKDRKLQTKSVCFLQEGEGALATSYPRLMIVDKNSGALYSKE